MICYTDDGGNHCTCDGSCDMTTCERCGDECSEMIGGLCCDCVRDRCTTHGEGLT